MKATLEQALKVTVNQASVLAANISAPQLSHGDVINNLVIVAALNILVLEQFYDVPQDKLMDLLAARAQELGKVLGVTVEDDNG